jgi:hypothetical protein
VGQVSDLPLIPTACPSRSIGDDFGHLEAQPDSAKSDATSEGLHWIET